MKKILFLSVFALCAMLATLQSCKKTDLNASSPQDDANKTEVPDYVENGDDPDEIGYLAGDKDYPDSDENGNPYYQAELVTMKITQVYNSKFDSLPRFKYGSTTAKQKFATRQIVQTVDGGTDFTIKGYGFKTYDSTKCGVQCFIKGVEIPNAKVLAWSDDTIKVNFPKLELAEAITKTFSIKFKVWIANDKVGKANIARSKSRSCISKGQAAIALKPNGKKGIVLNLKAILQGTYALVNGTPLQANGLMRDSLRQLSKIPTTEPYSNMNVFTHVDGGGGETITSADLAITGDSAIIDWVFIEFRSATNPEIVVLTRSGLILANGAIKIKNTATIPKGFYYIAVRHRNHLAVMSHQPIDLNSAASYDFTAQQAFGIDSQRQLPNSKFVLRAGDMNNNGEILDPLDIDFIRTKNGLNANYDIEDVSQDMSISAIDLNMSKANKNFKSGF